MERNVLRENNNLEMQQSPLKSQQNGSLQESEVHSTPNGTSKTTKENYNPKPLSEIAADKSTKLNPNPFEVNTTSTPKVVKNILKDLSTSDLDITIDIEPNYRRENLRGDQNDITLSFLTDGLNKLGLESSAANPSTNLTFSDDEEQFVECQSFNDLSNRAPVNSTVVIDSQYESVASITENETETNENKTLTLNGHDEGANLTYEAGQYELDETKIISAANNETFDNVVHNEIEHQAKAETFDSFSIAQSINFEAIPVAEYAPQAQALEQTSTQYQEETVSPEPEEVKMEPKFTSPQIEISSPEKQELKQQEDIHTPKAQDQTESVSEVESHQETFSMPNEDLPPYFDGDITMAAVDVTIANFDPVFAQKPATPDREESSPMEISYRNIDESLKSLSKSMTNSSFNDISPPPPASTTEATEKPVEEMPAVIKAENVFVDQMESRFEVQFKVPSLPVLKSQNEAANDDEFKTCGSSFNFGESDLDYLQSFGASDSKSVNRQDSLLLKFDPLLNKPVIVQTHLAGLTEEEDDFVADFELKLPKAELSLNSSNEESASTTFGSATSNNDRLSQKLLPTEDEMSLSVDIMKDISVDNKTSESNHIEETKLSAHRNEDFILKMSELENKMKKEADMREEALLKRIHDKDKTIIKMNGVVEAYEKAISELIAEKEQIRQGYDKDCIDLKRDSELNANHLASLEATFSDLHAKYERTKQVATELKEREDRMEHDRQTLNESLKMQEARYDKMKAHAMSQLEIANNTLAEINRNHQFDVSKLKAQLKKEELLRASINEQLIQKTKENSELVKICDELINGSSS